MLQAPGAASSSSDRHPTAQAGPIRGRSAARMIDCLGSGRGGRVRAWRRGRRGQGGSAARRTSPACPWFFGARGHGRGRRAGAGGALEWALAARRTRRGRLGRRARGGDRRSRRRLSRAWPVRGWARTARQWSAGCEGSPATGRSRRGPPARRCSARRSPRCAASRATSTRSDASRSFLATIAGPGKPGPVRLGMSYGALGALHPSMRTISLRVAREGGARPRATDINAIHRRGDRVVVTFHVTGGPVERLPHHTAHGRREAGQARLPPDPAGEGRDVRDAADAGTRIPSRRQGHRRGPLTVSGVAAPRAARSTRAARDGGVASPRPPSSDPPCVSSGWRRARLRRRRSRRR